MFKGIYNVHFAGLQYSVVKVIPSMSKNRVRQSYLILNYCGLCEFFFSIRRKYSRRMRGGGADAGRWGGAQEGAYFAICELM